jgi:hypothetical protein
METSVTIVTNVTPLHGSSPASKLGIEDEASLYPSNDGRSSCTDSPQKL